MKSSKLRQVSNKPRQHYLLFAFPILSSNLFSIKTNLNYSPLGLIFVCLMVNHLAKWTGTLNKIIVLKKNWHFMSA